MEQHLGRRLSTYEYVHHRNDNKLDNRLDNLEIVEPGTHGRYHNLKYPITKLCVMCCIEFTPHKTKRKRQQTCGNKECVSALISKAKTKKTGGARV